MKKYLLLLIIPFTLLGNQSKQENLGKKSEEKKSYCYKPTGDSGFKIINSKGDNRIDIKFEHCMFGDKKVENVTLGILTKETDKTQNYIKKYAYLHFKDGVRIKETTKGNYYYDGKWAWSSASFYPASILDVVEENK